MTKIVCLLLVAAGTMMAQSRASISGEVTDSSGSALANVKVTAVSSETNITATATTNSSGIYLIQNLEVGSYNVSVVHEGFRTYKQTNIVLTTAETFGLNVKLEIGSVSETINVSASAATLDDKTSVISTTLEPAEVQDLPLGDRRTLNLVNLMPGAVFVDYVTGSKPNVSLAGGRTQSQMVMLDGGSTQNMRLGVGQLDTDPPAEAVQEMKILSNSYSAEYGGSAGGVIIQTSKSGTNRFKGSVYEFLRNNAFDAPGYFAPILNGQKTSPKLRYNVYGATLGGPVKKDRTFFFFSYEGRQLGVGGTTTLTVPTAAQRTGDFSTTTNAAGAVIQIFDPFSTATTAGKTTRTQFPGNVIPASVLDPVAMKALVYFPIANRPADNIAGANNFRQNTITWTKSNFYLGKVDHVFSERDRITGRFMYSHDLPTVYGPYGPNDYGDPAATTDASQTFGYLNEIHIFNPTTINEVRFNYGYRIAHARTNGVGQHIVKELGLTGTTDNAFPQFAPAGFSAIGATGQERRQYPIKNFQVIDSIAMMKGKHAFKFGFEARKSTNHEQNLPTGSGQFSFAAQGTQNPGVTATGNGLASMLVGSTNVFIQTQTPEAERYSWYLAGFVQDDYTVSSRLTLNIGVRWETDTPMRDTQNMMNGFDLNKINPVSGTPGVVQFMGLNGYRTSPWNGDWNNFGPRFGFAYRPAFSQKLVFRGGYAVQFAHPFDAGQPASANLGFGININLASPDSGLTAPFFLKNGVPNSFISPTLNDGYGAVAPGKATNTAITFFDASRRTGYSQQSNLSVQYQISSSMIMEVTAMSNIGHKLANVNMPINQIPTSILGPAHAAVADRPFPQFTSVTILSPSLGDSRYTAGFVRLTKRFTKGLNINASYTRATFLDNTFEAGAVVGGDSNANTYSDQYNRRADWGPSGNDIRHRATFSSVYELPFGYGKRWMANGLMGQVVGGWTLGTILVAQSGAPSTVITNTNNTNANSAGAQRANVIGDPVLPGDQRSPQRWFNTAAFAQPATYTFGNGGRGDIRCPGLFNMDMSILRNFRFREKATLQFRGEFLNALNHTNLSTPNASFGNAAFGSITAARAARVMQIGMNLRF